MKTETSPQNNFSSVLLTGTILLANMDIKGLTDYGLKAAIGGAIWLFYKIVADYIERKNKNKQP